MNNKTKGEYLPRKDLSTSWNSWRTNHRKSQRNKFHLLHLQNLLNRKLNSQYSKLPYLSPATSYHTTKFKCKSKQIRDYKMPYQNSALIDLNLLSSKLYMLFNYWNNWLNDKLIMSMNYLWHTNFDLIWFISHDWLSWKN